MSEVSWSVSGFFPDVDKTAAPHPAAEFLAPRPRPKGICAESLKLGDNLDLGRLGRSGTVWSLPQLPTNTQATRITRVSAGPSAGGGGHPRPPADPVTSEQGRSWGGPGAPREAGAGTDPTWDDAVVGGTGPDRGVGLGNTARCCMNGRSGGDTPSRPRQAQEMAFRENEQQKCPVASPAGMRQEKGVDGRGGRGAARGRGVS